MTDRALPSAVAAHGPVTPCGYFYLAHTSEYAFASTPPPIASIRAPACPDSGRYAAAMPAAAAAHSRTGRQATS